MSSEANDYDRQFPHSPTDTLERSRKRKKEESKQTEETKTEPSMIMLIVRGGGHNDTVDFFPANAVGFFPEAEFPYSEQTMARIANLNHARDLERSDAEWTDAEWRDQELTDLEQLSREWATQYKKWVDNGCMRRICDLPFCTPTARVKIYNIRRFYEEMDGTRTHEENE